MPLRSIRSTLPRSMSEKYTPLFRWPSTSMSDGRTRIGSRPTSVTAMGGRKRAVRVSQSSRRKRFTVGPVKSLANIC